MSQLNVRVEELSPVVRRLDINVPADRVTQVTDAVYQRLGRTVKLKGYRQGHVPRRVLEKYFADQVKTDVAREIVDQTFGEALGTTNLSPVAAPMVEPQELKLGEDFSYSARVEVRPEITLQQYKGLQVTVGEHAASDKDVEAQLEQLREAMTTLEPVEGRDTLEMGDIAGVSWEIAVEGQPPQKKDDALVRIEAGDFIDGHGGKIAGAKIGETREFTEVFPTEDVSEEFKGKTAKITIGVKNIKKRVLPNLDDEFAKDVGGGAETLEALKAKIRSDLESQAAEANKRERREALLQKLVELNPVEVPPALVDSTADRLAQEFVQNLARRGLNLEGRGPVVEQYKQSIQPKALFDVKTAFLLDAVAKAENITVSQEDLDARMEKIAAEAGVPLTAVRQAYRHPQNLNGLAGTIRGDKALAFVEEHAQVTVDKEGGAKREA